MGPRRRKAPREAAHAAPRWRSPGWWCCSASPLCSACPADSGWPPWRKAWGADPRAHRIWCWSARAKTRCPAAAPPRAWRAVAEEGQSFLPCPAVLGWQWPAGPGAAQRPRASARPSTYVPEALEALAWAIAVTSARLASEAGEAGALLLASGPIDLAPAGGGLWWAARPTTSPANWAIAPAAAGSRRSESPASITWYGGEPPADRCGASPAPESGRLALVSPAGGPGGARTCCDRPGPPASATRKRIYVECAKQIRGRPPSFFSGPAWASCLEIEASAEAGSQTWRKRLPPDGPVGGSPPIISLLPTKPLPVADRDGPAGSQKFGGPPRTASSRNPGRGRAHCRQPRARVTNC